MTFARTRNEDSHVIAFMPSTVVAACAQNQMLVCIDCIRTSSRRWVASLATAIAFVLPSCAVLAESLYVANAGNNTVSKFDASGQFLSEITNGGSGFYLSSPGGVVFDSLGNLYVANSGNNTVSKFDSTGAFVSEITNGGSAFYLSSPRGLVFDSLGNLYVANSGNNTVSKFDATGQFVSEITNGGSGFYLSSPRGIALDSLGNLYVTNFGNSTISKFDSTGQFVSEITNGGSGPYLSSPSAVAITAVPEPSTCVMALAGIACGGYLVRRCRKRT